MLPVLVKGCQEFRHWEGDSIVGKGQKGHLITLVERKIGIELCSIQVAAIATKLSTFIELSIILSA